METKRGVQIPMGANPGSEFPHWNGRIGNFTGEAGKDFSYAAVAELGDGVY